MHPTSIDGFETLDDAARAIGKLRYDALSVFLWQLMFEMGQQRDKDFEKGKKRLAKDADDLIQALGDASESAGYLFYRYRKYMEEELAKNPEMRYPSPE